MVERAALRGGWGLFLRRSEAQPRACFVNIPKHRNMGVMLFREDLIHPRHPIDNRLCADDRTLIVRKVWLMTLPFDERPYGL